MKLICDDIFHWTQEYKTLPREYLNIPSVHMMGYANFDKTHVPLENHYHKMLEVVVVVNGEQHYSVGGNKYALHGRDVFITYPDEEHGNENLPQSVCEFIWFQLDLSSSDSFLGLSGNYASYVYNCIQRFISSGTHRLVVDDTHLKLLKKAWGCLVSDSEGAKMLGWSCLLGFIIQIFCVPETGKIRPKVSKDIEAALSYIDGNLMSPISIQQVAQSCGLSESRFKSKFKEQMGITPLAYMNTEKIEMAKFLLRENIISVTEIAVALSFSSSNYFSSVFKKYTGYSPTDYKARFPKNGE